MPARFRYKAFISYSHADERWAKWLHRALESYRPPKALGLEERLKPIFRDRDELSASRDLSAEIQAALADAENLIVICSPSAARSHWVNEEVRHFASLGRADRTYCLFVDGTPNDPETECLPEALKSDAGTEPLGADARPGADGKTGAKLKIAAALLGVRYDQLRQRDQQARVRRLALVAGSSVVGMVLAGALAVFALVSRQEAIEARNEADAQRAVAVRETEVANQTTEFMIDLFDVSDPSEARGNSITAREVLDLGASKLEGSGAMEPGIRARLLLTIGRVYQELGLYEPASTALTQSLQLQRSHADPDPLKLTNVLDEVGLLFFEIGDYDAARRHYQEALEIRQAALEAPHVDIVQSLHDVALTHWRQYEISRAMELAEAARDMLGRVPGEHDGMVNNLKNTIANLYSDQGRHEEAEPLYRELLEARYAEYGENHLQTGFAHDNLAMTLDMLEAWDDAESHYRKALDILRTVYGDDHPEVAQTMGNLGAFLLYQGSLDEAEALFLRAIEIHREKIGEDYFMVADSLTNLAELELERGNAVRALGLSGQGLDIYARQFSPTHGKVVSALVLRAEILAAQERFSEAETLLLDLDASVDPQTQPYDQESVTDGLSGLYEAWGKPAVLGSE